MPEESVIEKQERFGVYERLRSHDPETVKQAAKEFDVKEQIEQGYVPLMMGGHPIGLIKFDPNTGDISGRLTDTSLVEMMRELFPAGLLEVSFFGKPGVPMTEAQQMIHSFFNPSAQRR